MKILIVEDNPDLRENILTYLSRENYICETAEDYEQGFDKIMSYSYDLALIDIMLPKGNGFISINLTPEALTISNSGDPTDIPTDHFFKRFRKADHNSTSIGLGLAIVERIVRQSGLDVSYKINQTVHTVTVELKNVNNG